MSMDIRSFFSKQNSTSASKPKPETPQSKKRSRVINDTDDEDDDIVDISKKKPKKSPSTSNSKNKKPEVVVQVNEFFNSKVQQKNRTIKPKSSESEKEKEKSTQKKQKEKKVGNDDIQVLSSKKKKVENDDIKFLSSEKEKVEDKIERTPKKEKLSTPKKEDVKRKTPKKDENLTAKESKSASKEEKKANNSLLGSDHKRRNAEAYQKFLNRSGPKNPGSKKIPKGTPTCLQDLSFVITGVLDSLEREEATQLIQKCGGRVVGSVSKKTNYIVVGEEPGASKIQKAEDLGTKKLTEDELLDLIRSKSDEKEEAGGFIHETPEKTSKYFDKGSPNKKIKDEKYKPSTSKKFKLEEKKETDFKLKPETEISDHKTEDKGTSENILWVEKYKPKSTKNIIGQMGEKSSVKKLINWLQNWYKYNSAKGGKKATRPAPWVQDHDGGFFKAALLSGPPGVGKTTTAHLVCQELGFDLIEFNASDTRSKRVLQEEVAQLLSSRSIRGYFQGSGGSFKKHVLLMDEVDGMAGNEDRGGIQELIQLIKTTKIPIVAICNDRNHQKMRTLVNYCFDLKFPRPRVQQIIGAMKSICFKEKVDISSEALEELVTASNSDIRQVLHNLSLLAFGKSSLTLKEAQKTGQDSKKPLNLSPWDVTRKVFSASEHEKISFKDKTDLFFQDYSLGPLFVQDTYLRVKPYKAKNEKQKLELISKAADSLVLGDVIEKAIRSLNAWELLPIQAVFSSVMPGHYMSGHVQGQVQFPVWLGKNSRRNKFDRLLQDLHSSLRLNVSGSKQAVNMDYLQHLRNRIVEPLIEKGSEGVRSSLDFMLEYHLTRENLNSLLELSTWPGFDEPFSKVDSKVKAALTRALNKEEQAIVTTKKSSKAKGDGDIFDLEDDEEDVEDAENDNIDSDPMIKVGKPKVKKEPQSKEPKKKSTTSSKKGKK